MRRERLLAQLDDGVGRPLTLVAGPPGAGKTALLGSWVAAGRPPGPVAWLSLDPADGDRRRFWRAVFEALARAGVDPRLATLAARPEARVDALIAALAATLEGEEEPVVLVLDDFHDVADTIHGDVELLLRHPLPALRLIVSTRADPPLHLGRLRLQDQLTEIRAPDLALTVDEAAEMLAGLGIALAGDPLRRLWEHTEGWVGAIRLASLSLRDHPEPERFVDDFAGDDRAISDYLLAEVMSTLAPEDRSFVLRTAIVGVLNGELADELTEGADGHRRLAELARGGALLTAVDRRGEWYRYHSLLGELLRAELRSEAPDELAALHRRAAVWLAARGDDARGFLHATEAGAWDLAAALAGERWVDLLIRGEIGTLRPLVDRLPSDRIEADPELALAFASVMLDRGDAAAAELHLRRAEQSEGHVPADRRARFDAALIAVRLYAARLRGDLEAMLETGRALAARGGLEPGAVDTDVRALALTNLGIAEVWCGDDGAAQRQLERGRIAAAEAGREWLVLTALAHLAILVGARHDYVRGARLAGEAVALARRRGWEQTWPAGAAYLALATEAELSGRADEADVALEHARGALAGTPERGLRACLALLRSAMLSARGDDEAALAVVVAGREELGEWPLRPSIGDHFAVREAALRASLGDRERALALLADPPSLPLAAMLAELQLADGDVQGARATLAPWRPELERERSPSSVQGWIVEALALDALADHEDAAAALERALDRADPSGQRAVVLALGRSLEPLLRRQLRRETAHEALVADLLGALGRDARGAGRTEVAAEPLSPRERAVLRYLPTMMSNQEIAAELFVSINTVKTHLKAIYRKLDVQDRREAVRRARTMNLLAP